MKTIYLIIIGFLFCNTIYSQDIVSQLLKFDKNADMDCYFDKMQKNINDYFIFYNELWGRDELGIQPKEIKLHKDKIVSMLTIQFVGTDTFNLSDDIYNYITIDSIIVYTLACVDKKMNVKAFAHFFAGVHGYSKVVNLFPNKWREKRNLKKIIKRINKQEPELILYCHSLRGFHDSNGFMYVKNGKIYVYRVYEKDIYELNEYIRKFYSLERIRNLNYRFIPLHYQRGKSTRKTGNAPEDQKIICH